MYSFTRSLIGPKLREDADPAQRRRQHDEHERQAVDADLVLDAEERDPVGDLDRTGSRAALGREKPTSRSSERTQVASAGPSATARTRPAFSRGTNAIEERAERAART